MSFFKQIKTKIFKSNNLQNHEIDHAIALYDKELFRESFEIFNNESLRKFPISQYYLAKFYENGHCTRVDYAKALNCYKHAAKLGHMEAQEYLGDVYFYGMLGLNKDSQQSFEWYAMAAKKGSSRGLNNAATLYSLMGDDATAIPLYLKSAEKGNVHAQRNLGEIYYRSETIPQNYTEAIKWFTLAADSGDLEAKEILDEIRIIVSKNSNIN